jgi:hypothetical protein
MKFEDAELYGRTQVQLCREPRGVLAWLDSRAGAMVVHRRPGHDRPVATRAAVQPAHAAAHHERGRGPRPAPATPRP